MSSQQARVGPYPVTGILGEGGFGTVYLGRDPASNAPLAVKVFDRFAAGDPGWEAQIREDLRAESAALRQVEHPNCVRIRDVIDTPKLAAIVTDLIDGASLRRLLKETGSLSGPQALGVLHGALSGLVAVHEAGLVHGDLKPENVLLDRSGVSRLVDFGLAAPPRSLLNDPEAASTPSYTSPERVLGRSIDERSDLYACAVMLFELLCGRRPYVATSPEVIERMQVEAPVPDARDVVPDVGEGLAALCSMGMAKDPEERPQTARAFLRILEHAAADRYGADWMLSSALGGVVGAVLGTSAAVGMTGSAGAAAGGATGAGATGTGTALGAGLTAKATLAALGTAAIVGAGGASYVAAQRDEPSAVEVLAATDLRNFTYAGGCGWDAPWQHVTLENGRQSNRTAEWGDVSSSARMVGTKRITLQGTPYAVVTLACDIGQDTRSAVHLIGVHEQQTADLGIIGKGLAVTARVEDGRLRVTERFQSIHDSNADASGRTDLTVEVVGSTPVRVFGRSRDDGPEFHIPSDTADLDPHTWDRGLVAVGSQGPYDEPSGLLSEWAVGVAIRPDLVLTRDAYGAPASECGEPYVFDRSGRGHEVTGMSDLSDGQGTLLRLEAPLQLTEPTQMAELAFGESTLMAGVDGLVPTLAVPERGIVEQVDDEVPVSSYESMIRADRLIQYDSLAGNYGNSAALVGSAGVAAVGQWYTPAEGVVPERGMIVPEGQVGKPGEWYCES